MGALLLTLALGAAQPVSLAIPGLSPVNITRAEAELHSETLAQQLIALHFKVQTGRDLATALGLERQKELLGCEDSSCVTEIAGALGAEGIVVGDVGALGSEYALNVKVITPGGQTLALYSARASRAEEMPATLAAAARAIAQQLSGALHRPELMPKVASAPLGPDRREWALLPAAVAVVGLGLGVGLQVAAGDQFALLTRAAYDKQARDAHDQGKAVELAGNLALAVGAVGAAAALAVLMLGGPRALEPAAVVTPQGAWFGVAGTWP